MRRIAIGVNQVIAPRSRGLGHRCLHIKRTYRNAVNYKRMIQNTNHGGKYRKPFRRGAGRASAKSVASSNYIEAAVFSPVAIAL